ncbi:MAG: M20/M25/M40 family metallo-hydrolase [Dysgonamonadaceae bacterium]|jgi:hypothetical protein|nr:M20/M25/M40 family metallo-hydrolase [Dysgonamonadaceae bacterium]
MRKSLFSFIIIISFIFSAFGQTKIETADYLPYVHKDSINRTMQDLENFTTRYAPKGNKHVAEYIQQRLVDYGVANTVIDSFYVESTIWFDSWKLFRGYCYNVRGSIEGTENPDSIVIIGAHLDAINLVYNPLRGYVLNKELSPGADDNASGVAIMIEMARIMHQYQLKPQNRIDLLAFDAEEIGLYGGAYDAKRRITEGDDVVIMINNDMVSCQPENKDYTINIHWYNNAVPEANHAADMCREYSTITPVLPQGNDNSSREASDSWEYAKKGIKSVFFIEYFFTDYYHTKNDLCKNSNFEYVQEVGKVNFALLNHYAKFDGYFTGIQTKTKEESFSVYPNPVRKMATVTISSEMFDMPYTLQIFDAFGRLCYQTSLTQQYTPIDFSEFSSGLYVVKLIVPGGHSYTQKIIISN